MFGGTFRKLTSAGAGSVGYNGVGNVYLYGGEFYTPLAETSPDAVITPAIAARVLAKEGGFDVLFINQADVLEDPAAALQPFADALTCPAIYGALAEGYWAKL